MLYKNTRKAIFKNKINRFVANVIINGIEEQVHIKNTGRLNELLVKDAIVVLEKTENPNRKTKYDLVSVYKDGNLVNIDSQILNTVAFNYISKNEIIDKVTDVKREVKYKHSRFDLYFKKNSKECFLEVKGVNLVKNGFAMFPDAPTERGSKHIQELIEAQKEGYKTFILFLIAMDYVNKFTINKEMDMEFYKNILKARDNGVEILAYNLKITENDVKLNEKIEIIF